MTEEILQATTQLLTPILPASDSSLGLRGLRTGVDAVDIAILARQLDGIVGRRFRDRVFTPQEIRDARGEDTRFASRWAIKEAVAKAIGTGFRNGLRPSHIEVVTAPDGSVAVRAAPVSPSWPNGACGWRWSVSATHESGIAIAIALAVPGAT